MGHNEFYTKSSAHSTSANNTRSWRYLTGQLNIKPESCRTKWNKHTEEEMTVRNNQTEVWNQQNKKKEDNKWINETRNEIFDKIDKIGTP